MSSDAAEKNIHEHLEISMRFRRIIESRIARLESDAASDESMLERLDNSDHMRRHMRLIAVQRDEASRMRRFLAHSNIRLPNPITAL
jgi:hypothetical protein